MPIILSEVRIAILSLDGFGKIPKTAFLPGEFLEKFRSKREMSLSCLIWQSFDTDFRVRPENDRNK